MGTGQRDIVFIQLPQAYSRAIKTLGYFVMKCTNLHCGLSISTQLLPPLFDPKLGSFLYDGDETKQHGPHSNNAANVAYFAPNWNELSQNVSREFWNGVSAVAGLADDWENTHDISWDREP